MLIDNGVGSVDTGLLVLIESLDLFIGIGHLSVIGLHVLSQVGDFEAIVTLGSDGGDLSVANFVLLEDLLDQFPRHLVHVVDIGLDVDNVVEIYESLLNLGLLETVHAALGVKSLIGRGELLFLLGQTSDQFLVVKVFTRSHLSLVVRVFVTLHDFRNGAILLLGGVNMFYHSESLHGIGTFIARLSEILFVGVSIEDLGLQVVE